MWSLSDLRVGVAELPGGDDRPSSAGRGRGSVEGGDRRVEPHAPAPRRARPSAAGRARRRSAGRRRRSSRRRPSATSSSTTGWTIVRRRQDGVGDAVERGEALDRDRPEAVGPGVTSRTAAAGAGGSPAGASDRGACRRRSRSRARAPSRAASRPRARPRSCPATVPSKTSPVRAVDRDDVAGLRASARRSTTRPSPTSIPAAPTTAGMPQPRATTAAWLARPPREVRIPAARAIPWTSSGDVSARTRIGRPPGRRPPPGPPPGRSRSARWRSRARRAGRWRAASRRLRRALGDRAADGRAAARPARRPRARVSGNARVLGHVDARSAARPAGCACRPGPGASRAGRPRS